MYRLAVGALGGRNQRLGPQVALRKAAGGPMQTARVAMRAARLSRSAVETATTLSMPSRSQARTTRTAISPRLATRIRLKGGAGIGAA
jgi:hypothetical protein